MCGRFVQGVAREGACEERACVSGGRTARNRGLQVFVHWCVGRVWCLWGSVHRVEKVCNAHRDAVLAPSVIGQEGGSGVVSEGCFPQLSLLVGGTSAAHGDQRECERECVRVCV